MVKRYIIVTEDDPLYANIYKMKLTKAGYEVEIAVNADEVLEKTRQRKPDLILLDLILPGKKDGFDVLKELKADEKLKDVKVVVVSNLSQEEDYKRASRLGADVYLFKVNMSIDDMVEKVKQILSK